MTDFDNSRSRPTQSGENRDAQEHPYLDGLNVLGLLKGDDYYIFLYTDQMQVQTFRTFGRFAADPELNFSWYDASILTKKVREIAAQFDSDGPRNQEDS